MEKMSKQEFVDLVNSGCFTDFDGVGYLADQYETSTQQAVFPSDVENNKHFDWPSWATHVEWNNK